MEPIIIDNWSTSLAGNPFQAPEVRALVVTGTTENDPRRPGKTPITTSRVVEVNGREFKTRSGTLYRLGRIDPKFRAWLRKEGRQYDPREPIKTKEPRK